MIVAGVVDQIVIVVLKENSRDERSPLTPLSHLRSFNE
jgi:hypothetical protein